MRKTPAFLSLLLHGAAAALVLLLVTEAPRRLRREEATPLTWKITAPARNGNTGGGGGNDPRPPARGRAPEFRQARIFVPPQIRDREAALPVTTALLELPAENLPVAQVGDPLAAIPGYGNGPGGLDGIGTGRDRGIGPGEGPRQGAAGFRVGTRRGYLSRPRVIHQTEPEYSDEARKARLQGTVVLSCEVDEQGRPRSIRVVRPLGLGLDERAIEALEKWRFQPAVAGGKPVAAQAVVEMTFRLL